MSEINKVDCKSKNVKKKKKLPGMEDKGERQCVVVGMATCLKQIHHSTNPMCLDHVELLDQ